jgi:hypothetical protein
MPGMPQRLHKTSGPDIGASEKEKSKKEEEPPGDEDECRCKEVAKKTPFEMLKLMISDLAFWKKTKK